MSKIHGVPTLESNISLALSRLQIGSKNLYTIWNYSTLNAEQGQRTNIALNEQNS